MPDSHARRIGKAQGDFAALAFPLLALGGLGLGIELFETSAGAVGLMLLLPGCLAVFLATRRPPMDPPAPKVEAE